MSSRFSRYSEADASEFLENREGRKTSPRGQYDILSPAQYYGLEFKYVTTLILSVFLRVLKRTFPKFILSLQ